MTAEANTDDPQWYHDAVDLRAARQGLRRRQRRRHRRLPRPDRASSTTCSRWASTRSGCCPSTRRRCATTATTSPTTETCTRHYGTLDDFRAFVAEAHRRGLRVITELVVNHTSDQHPWFQAARRAPKGSPERDFYVWSDDPKLYTGTRIIFTDTEKSNWTLGRGRPAVLLAPLLQPPAGPELRQPGGARGGARRSWSSGSTWASTASGSTPSPT